MDFPINPLFIVSASSINSIMKPIYFMDIEKSISSLFNEYYPDFILDKVSAGSIDHYGKMVYLDDEGNYRSVFFSDPNGHFDLTEKNKEFYAALDTLIQECPEPTEWLYHPQGRQAMRLFNVDISSLPSIDITTNEDATFVPLDEPDIDEIFILTERYRDLKRYCPTFEKKAIEFTDYLEKEGATYSLTINLRSITFFEEMKGKLLKDPVKARRCFINHLLYNPFRPTQSIKSFILGYPTEKREGHLEDAEKHLQSIKDRYQARIQEGVDSALTDAKVYIAKFLQTAPDLFETNCLLAVHQALIFDQNWEELGFLTKLLEINQNHTYYPKTITPELKYAVDEGWVVEHISKGRREENVGYSFTLSGVRTLKILRIVANEKKKKVVSPKDFDAIE